MNDSKDKSIGKEKECKNKNNPLWHEQKKFLQSIQNTAARENFFDTSRVSPEERADIWSEQAAVGEDLINKYSWATPDDRAIRIIRNFAPIVEIGCGKNGYWAKCLKKSGVDIVAFDKSVDNGGQIMGGRNIETKKKKRRMKNKISSQNGFRVQQGGPEVLLRPEICDANRNLMLCYPDENLLKEEITDLNNIHNGEKTDDVKNSLGSACLEHFSGEYVIHVGELFGDSICLENAPYGRSSAPLFQERLAGEFHCIVKASLQNYLHSKDTISVWKRSKRCTIVFQDEGSNNEASDEEVDYKDIPVEERLPVDIAAPLYSFLLSDDCNQINSKEGNVNLYETEVQNVTNEEKTSQKKRRKNKRVKKEEVVPGCMW